MNHLLGVEVVHGVGHIDGNLDPQKPAQFEAVILEFGSQVSAGDKLGHYVDARVVLAQPKQLHDVWMTKAPVGEENRINYS